MNAFYVRREDGLKADSITCICSVLKYTILCLVHDTNIQIYSPDEMVVLQTCANGYDEDVTI